MRLHKIGPAWNPSPTLVTCALFYVIHTHFPFSNRMPDEVFLKLILHILAVCKLYLKVISTLKVHNLFMKIAQNLMVQKGLNFKALLDMLH